MHVFLQMKDDKKQGQTLSKKLSQIQNNSIKQKTD